MKFRIRRCKDCWAYTLAEKCPYCQGETEIAHPKKCPIFKYYVKYRRKVIIDNLKIDHHDEEKD